MKNVNKISLAFIALGVAVFISAFVLDAMIEEYAYGRELLLLGAIISAVGVIISSTIRALTAPTTRRKFVRGTIPVAFFWLAVTLAYLMPCLHQYEWLGYAANTLMTITGIWGVAALILDR